MIVCCRHGRCEDDARRLAKYLLQLFGKPTLETNLILVVTNVSHNERDIWQRKQRGTSIDTLLEMYHRQIKDAFQLEHDFQVIDIDTGPVSSH